MTDHIDAIDLHLIESPIRSARSHGSGHVKMSVQRVIVRVRTQDGLAGWGEAAPWAPFGNVAAGTMAVLATTLRPALLGRDPAAITARAADCAAAIAGHPEAKVAIDMALWDIAGKRAGLPVHALLGGAVRETIPLSFSIANPDFAADLERARELFAQGHRILKVKTGYLPHAQDLKRLEALRANLPELDLRVDYNQGLAPMDAIRTLRDIEAFRPTFIEQPVPRGQEAALAAITAALDTPVLADESVYSPDEMLRAARERLADCVSIKLMKAGGYGPARAIDAIASAAGMPSYGGTLWEGGIAAAAGAHLLAALPNCTLGCEFYMPSYALVRDICPDPLLAGGGVVRVPQEVGLGVEVDEAELAALAVAG
ncbi:MAG: cycloisomerase [Rhodospirillales bacterium]|nr:cycloisomerase [Rhodospirillales bacterium]